MPFPAFSRVRLIKALPDLNLPQGAIGKIKRVVPGDETKYVTAFDLLPGLVVDLYQADFDPRSPQRCAEIVYGAAALESEPATLVCGCCDGLGCSSCTDDDGLPL